MTKKASATVAVAPAVATPNENFRSFRVGNQLWLVRAGLCADGHFASAVESLRNTPHGGAVLWGAQESAAFFNVWFDSWTTRI